VSRIRVFVVEDSPTQSHALTRLLEAGGDIVVVGTAADAGEAVAGVHRLRPDVVTMDLDIPGGGGQQAIDTIMSDRPTPILVITGLVGDAGAPLALEALAGGAVEVLPKPRSWTPMDADDLRRRVKRARGVPVIGRRRRRGAQAPPTSTRATSAVVGVAASTGGPAAVAGLVRALKGVQAPLLVVQHIHPSFADGFAGWLQSASGRPVQLARGSEGIKGACVYVAPAERHLALGPDRRLVVASEPRTLHRPSADVLFESLARHAGRHGIGVVLTGMGADGARGLAALRAAGGKVLVQDRDSSVVFGMPQAALRAGAARDTVPLEDLPAAIRAAIEAMG
jgi:two-component system chemotaxis response regulator CheB